MPERDVGPVRKADLEGPVIIDLRGRENSRLCVVIESVNERVARHQIVRRELRFNVRLSNNAADSRAQIVRERVGHSFPNQSPFSAAARSRLQSRPRLQLLLASIESLRLKRSVTRATRSLPGADSTTSFAL